MVDAHVMVIGYECIVWVEGLDVNNAVRNNFLFNDRKLCFGSCVRHDGRKTLPPRISKPSTTTLPDAPLPRLSFRIPPKQLSSASVSPFNPQLGMSRFDKNFPPHVETNGRA
jgi:hypothetical protein